MSANVTPNCAAFFRSTCHCISGMDSCQFTSTFSRPATSRTCLITSSARPESVGKSLPNIIMSMLWFPPVISLLTISFTYKRGRTPGRTDNCFRRSFMTSSVDCFLSSLSFKDTPPWFEEVAPPPPRVAEEDPADANAVSTFGFFCKIDSICCITELVFSRAVPGGSMIFTERSPVSVCGIISVPTSGKNSKAPALIPRAPITTIHR